MNIETQKIFETAKEIYKDKDFQTVREILEKLLRSNSNNVEVLTLLGNTYYCLENFNRSADVYKKIVQKQPWNTQKTTKKQHNKINQYLLLNRNSKTQ